jgi:hypothetical protein
MGERGREMKCLVCKDRNVVYWGKWCCECVEVMSKRAREKRMSEPTKEYLFAKAELCTKIARQQEERAEIAEALRNIERANRAMARIFNLEEEENE